MVRIESLPDLSRFVKQEEKTTVYNTVHLLDGEDSIEVSGPVISQASRVLQDLVGKRRELDLEEFSGEIQGVQDCVELLYGGGVILSVRNVRTVIKFSAVYQIPELLDVCMVWLHNNISAASLFARLESCADIGILIDGKKCVQTRVKTAFNYKKFLKQIFSILRFVLIISIDSTFLFDRTRKTSTQRAQTFFNIKYIFSTF